ncbi:MAG: TSUP family transporter [Betaproteobacteria bacterium]|nr:TSUP family transporter [Betaproteobacteria bacterium]
MDFLVVCLAALVASGLTLFSGFGLGTILTPVFALFFPVPMAVAMTAVVHLANNLFKIGLVGREADWRIVARFGLPAALAAIAGASLLALFAAMPAIAGYELAGRAHEITPVKAAIGLLIVGFALLELSPRFARLAFPPRWLPLGGLLSGFFGGLSGNQGALRSAFLIRAGLSKEAFVGTGAACAVLVDTVRLGVYGASFQAGGWAILQGDGGGLVLVATLCAFLGAWLGKRLLKKVTLCFVELTVAAMMVVIGGGLAVGLL